MLSSVTRPNPGRRVEPLSSLFILRWSSLRGCVNDQLVVESSGHSYIQLTIFVC